MTEIHVPPPESVDWAHPTARTAVGPLLIAIAIVFAFLAFLVFRAIGRGEFHPFRDFHMGIPAEVVSPEANPPRATKSAPIIRAPLSPPPILKNEPSSTVSKALA